MTFSEDKLAPFSGQTFLMMDPFVSNNFKKIKAFTDVGNIEAMSKERWGAAKWVKGQLRMYGVNDSDAQAERRHAYPSEASRATWLRVTQRLHGNARQCVVLPGSK